jgi:hypothetical protein
MLAPSKANAPATMAEPRSAPRSAASPAGGGYEARACKPGQDQRRGGAALQEQSGAKPGGHGLCRVVEACLQEDAETVAPGAHDAGAHHAHAPQKQCYGAGKIDDHAGRGGHQAPFENAATACQCAAGGAGFIAKFCAERIADSCGARSTNAKKDLY